ncbi:MAG: glycosyl hydrolase [Chitinophagaceae bacterium]
MKKYLIGILIITSFTGYSQQTLKWPAITRQTKPWTRWWWEGSAVNKADLTAAMQLYQKAGLGGMEITPIYGVKGTEDQFINYLSPKWLEMLQHTLQEAKRLGLGIDLATGTGWPFGGPWVTPEDACKDLSLKTYTLKAGERLQEKITYMQKPLVRTVGGQAVDIKILSYPIATNKNLQAYAFDQVKYEMNLPLRLLMAYSDTGEKLDITSNTDLSGVLNWEAPPGNWTLYALFMGWHGKMVERAAPGGEGDAIDHFSSKALQNYLSHFDQAFKGHDVSGIRSFFNDSYEVDDAQGQANWTPEFLNEFKNRRGYDLRDHLTALFKIDTAEINSRVLYDYRLTISELLLEKFTRPWHAWAKSKGALIRNQSHGSPANILDLYSAIDIPETEGTDILRFKFATSAAHVMGKPLASSESATWLNEHFKSSLSDVKLALDKYFVGGVNHIFYHGTNYSPQQAVWPGWLFYAAVHFTPANSFWKQFSAVNNYVAHVQSFLQKGKPDNDVLLFFPVNDRFSEPLAPIRSRRNINAYTEGQATPDEAALKNRQAGNAGSRMMKDSIDALSMNLLQHFDGMEGFENTIFKTSAEYLLKEGYAFDLISDKQLQQVQAVNNKLVTGGVNYQTVLLSDCKYITVETLDKLIKLAESGAIIVFYKNLPVKVPGFGQLGNKQETLQKQLSRIHFSKIDNISVQKSSVGKGAFIKGDDLSQLLSFAKIRQENMVKQDLLFVRRRYETGHVYFISNSGNTKVSTWVPLSVKATGVALFDPMLERSGLAKKRKTSDGITEVFLNLVPGESCIVQTSSSATKANLFPYIELAGEPRELKGEWEIKFTEGGPSLPKSVLVTQLGSWTDLPGDEVKIFSGTAQYSVSLKKPAGTVNGWLLDLGNVQQSAEVWLNGKKRATLVGPTYQVVIPYSQIKTDNLLQIIVCNGMANRIADLDKRGVEWKKFYNVNFPSRLAENRNPNGIFDASKWKPEASGLLGPVTLTPVK